MVARLSKGLWKMNVHSMIFPELDPEPRRARRTLRLLGAMAAGAAIAAVWLSSSSPVFAAMPAADTLCREYFQAHNYDKAKMHCAAAAEDGNSGSQAALGWMYLHGKGVPQNDAEARRLVTLSAEHGNIAASAVLGGMYLNGAAVGKDLELAREWIAKAAEGGSAAGQAALGEAYRLGLGVEQNEVSAYMWYTLAADQGSRAAADARQAVASRMKPEQIARAEEKARDWKDSHADRIDQATASRQ